MLAQILLMMLGAAGLQSEIHLARNDWISISRGSAIFRLLQLEFREVVKMRRAKNKCLALLAVSMAPMAANAVPIVSQLDPALSGATVYGFEDVVSGGHPTITSGILTVSAAAGDVQAGSGNCEYAPPSGDQCYVWYQGALSLDFSTGVSAFGMVIGATNFDWTLSSYDVLGNLLESVVVPAQVPSLPHPYSGFYGFSSATPIGSVSFAGSEGIVLDDIHYVVSTSVPEPGTLPVFGAALLAFGFMRHRRKA